MRNVSFVNITLLCAIFLGLSDVLASQVSVTSSSQHTYRGADKSLARPGRKQARKHVRDARSFNNIETRAVIKIFFSLQGKPPKEIHAILTETLACFLPGRPKDLWAHLYKGKCRSGSAGSYLQPQARCLNAVVLYQKARSPHSLEVRPKTFCIDLHRITSVSTGKFRDKTSYRPRPACPSQFNIYTVTNHSKRPGRGVDPHPHLVPRS